HEELWVPAEELEDFNRHIQGPIRVIGAFFGDDFRGLVPEAGALRRRNAREQLSVLAGQCFCSPEGLASEIRVNRDAVFLHFPFWQSLEASTLRLQAPKDEVLAAARQAWMEAFPLLPLLEQVGG